MTSTLRSLFLIFFFVGLSALLGCERVQNVVVDTVQPEDNNIIMVEPDPVKLVLLIDYPDGGKDSYLEWIVSIAPTLQAPDEVNRIRSYDNQDQSMSPNRLVEFEFNSFLDAASYLNRPEIVEIMADLPNRSSNVTFLTFIQRSDYTRGEEGRWPVKSVLLIDYPLGGKQAYLAWIDTVSSTIVEPSQLKAIASYDNYYGETPHRLVEFEFANQEDATAYGELDNIMAIEDELDVRAGSWTEHTFELRSDYIKE